MIDENKAKIEKVLDIWHKHFEDETYQYTEFEKSDIEYFVGCMLYNHFDFKNALDTMKTIDLSYDFLVEVEANYDEVNSLIKSICIDDELEKIEFLISYLDDAKTKYTQGELYLINRLAYHVGGVKQRYNGEIEAAQPDFTAPKKRSMNPLLR